MAGAVGELLATAPDFLVDLRTRFRSLLEGNAPLPSENLVCAVVSVVGNVAAGDRGALSELVAARQGQP